MNIDKVYMCDIYRLDDISYNNLDFKMSESIEFSLDNFLSIKRKISYVKHALVYYNVCQGCFIDLETYERYKLGYGNTIGELFVDIHKSKIYGKTLMSSNRKYYSKKKILKKYDEYKIGDIHECK